MGPFFLESWYLHGWCFKFPSGTSLPKPKLSNPPGDYLLFIFMQDKNKNVLGGNGGEAENVKSA